MASSSFRDSMNSLGWSRREQTANTNPQNPLLGTLSKLNPFSGEGYVRLPTTEGEGPGAPLPARTRREEEEGWFALRHLVSQERLPFTATYFGSIALTLYFAVGLRSTILTLLTSIIQLVALVWYLVSYFPMGSQGLRFAASFGGSRLSAWMGG
ncbi:hypothetical protein AC578_8785 [Pseudocercospora eumusae]|uniref:Protein transport protein SFT2 n=1 Tax=Pseudocercospora eumusae TaxID=321146 RepID=A0A139H6F7_9PEZI|nr:hypothetical protein AC578_8785 [Pseudocercospora eumusae]